MSRFGKLAAGAFLILPIVLGGCRPQRGTANPEDYFPLIQVALAGGETAAMIGRNEAIKAKSFGGCVAAESLVTAFDSSARILAGRLTDQIIIPAVEIDVSECLALRDAGDVTEPGEESASFRGPVVVSRVVAGYAPVSDANPEGLDPPGEAPAEESPTAEPPAEEAVPAEEAAPEEAAPAEEPAAEEEAPIELDSLKAYPQAAMLIDTLGGITIAAVLHYATKLQAANCKKGTAAIGAINYVGGMLKPVADELAEPDGKVSVPMVVIDLSECEEG